MNELHRTCEHDPFPMLKRLVAIFLLCCTIGCADGDPGVSVRGRVLVGKQPLGSSTLTFFPSGGRPISAAVSGDGSYSCQLPVGEYRVTVTVGVQLPAGWKEGDPVPEPRFQVPAKYSSRQKTPLQLSVTDPMAGTSDFTLD